VWLTAVEIFGECVKDLLSTIGPGDGAEESNRSLPQNAQVDSRSELQCLEWPALQKRALALGATRQYLEAIADKPDRTDALVDLIIEKESAPCASDQPYIIQHPVLGVQIIGAVEAPCQEAADIRHLLDYSTKKRAVGCMNVGGALSSRSHAFFVLRLDMRHSGRSMHSRLTLVDLAGSERMGQTAPSNSKTAFAFIRDGKSINRSLATLGWVVRELSCSDASIQNSIPFQASKLTFALKEALIGNSRTWLLAAVPPVAELAEETVATLKFAESVRRLRTSPRCSRGSWADTLSTLQEEATKLKVQVASGIRDTDAFRELAIIERQRLVEEVHRPRQLHADEAARLAREREKALKSVGLMTADAEEAFAFEQVTPYLINMSDDPQLAGCLLYFLRSGEEVNIGSDPSSTIVISGLNSLPRLCSMMNQDNVRVSLLRPDESRRYVLLNGQALPVACGTAEKDESARAASEFRLRHHDRLYLGFALVLRLHIPMQADVETIDESEEQSGAVPPPPTHELVLCKHPRECLPMLPERSQAFSDLQMYMQHSESFSELQLYMEDLYDKLDADRGHAFFRTLQEACYLIDEANAISRRVRPDDRLHFEVEFVWDIYRDVEDILMIRVMHCGEVVGRGDVVLHYWTYDKFRDRLDMMRDVFFVFQLTGWPSECKGDVFEDPWIEPGTADLQQRYLEAVLKERRRAAIAEDRCNSMSIGGSSNGRPSMALGRAGEQQQRRLASNTSEAERLRASPRPVRTVGNKTLSDGQSSHRSSRPLNRVPKVPQSGFEGGSGPDACAGDGALAFGYQPTWSRANALPTSGRATPGAVVPASENERLQDLVVSLQQQLAAVQLKTDSIDHLREQVLNMQAVITSAAGSGSATVATSRTHVSIRVPAEQASSGTYAPDSVDNSGMMTPSMQGTPLNPYVSPGSTYAMPPTIPIVRGPSNTFSVRRSSPRRANASPSPPRPPLAAEVGRPASMERCAVYLSNAEYSPAHKSRSLTGETGAVVSDIARSMRSQCPSPSATHRGVVVEGTAANIKSARPNSPPALPMRAYQPSLSQGGSLTIGAAAVAPIISVRPLSPPGSLQVNSTSSPSLHPIPVRPQASPLSSPSALSSYRDAPHAQSSPVLTYRNS